MSKKRQGAVFDPRRRRHRAVTTLTWDFAPGHRIAPHFHDQDQLVYASHGVMTVETDGGRWVVPPLRGVWIPRKVVHSIEMSGAVRMRTLYLRAGLVRGFADCAVVNVSPLLREMILEICAREGLDRRVAADRRMLAVLVDRIEAIPPAVPLRLPMPRDPRARDAARILLRRGVARPPDALARSVGASKRTLERLFHAETGLTLGRWRQQLRLLTGLRSLARGEKIVAAAFDAGYESPSAFIAMFRKALGVTPARYFRST
jgi:AraC-like DNA-binding protein